jgi:hypothetical protein
MIILVYEKKKIQPEYLSKERVRVCSLKAFIAIYLPNL